jgi:predicted secreted protein
LLKQKVIKAKSGVTVKSGQQATYPVRQEQKIESWRMRSELIDQGSGRRLGLLGKLQQASASSGQCPQRNPAAG